MIKKFLYEPTLYKVKNVDMVSYGGGERWKPNREIVDKDGKIKWWYQSPQENKEFNPDIDSYQKMTSDQKFQSDAWSFCDTIYIDKAEHNYHYLDYATTGQRMGWKQGDEYWFVFNYGMNRFELRPADPDKWDPLERYHVNKNLEIKLKIPFLTYDSHLNSKLCFIQDTWINSFPDRVQFNFMDKKWKGSILSVINGFKKYHKKNNEINYQNSGLMFNDFYFDSKVQKLIDDFKEKNPFGYHIHYGIEDTSIEDPKQYMEIFYKYNHSYKFHLKNKEKEE